jgi:multidrug efflux pump
VDDGIVVTENIFKKMEQGMDKWQAAREGSREIYFAVFPHPLRWPLYSPHHILRRFRGKAFQGIRDSCSGAVLISAFVSLTLTPVLNVKLTRKCIKTPGCTPKPNLSFVVWKTGMRGYTQIHES